MTADGQLASEGPGLEMFEVYPNPSEGIINLKFQTKSSQELVGKMYDTMGGVVKEFKVNLTVGSNEYRMDISELKEGQYILKLGDGFETYSKQIIKNN